MSLALIQECAKEVRRLAIAGSPLAVGDFRLKKLIAPLEQAGAKVPVFAQVAKATSGLVHGRETDSAADLLSLSTLLNAILYTQGQSSADGDYRELEMFPTDSPSTRMSARALKPLVQALTSTGSGRLETVKSAVEKGAFTDLRLIDPAIQALGDVYPELAELVADKVLPAYGPGIVPRLQAGLVLDGKKQDARRLRIMHQLDPAGTLPLCKTALEEGSPEVQAAALGCLGKHADCLPLVLEQAGAKNKLVRAAALEALAEHDRPETTKLFTELVKGKALDLLAGPFRALRNRQVLKSLLDEGQRVFGLLLEGDAQQLQRFWEILDCLETRKDAEVEDFALACFSQADKAATLRGGPTGSVAGEDVMIRLADLLYRVGTPRALEAILAQRKLLPPSEFSCVLRSALRSWPPSRVFEEFSPLLSQKKGAGKEKCAELERFVAATVWDKTSRFSPPLAGGVLDSAEPEPLEPVTWDARWLDAAIKTDHQTIVCCLARPNHEAALDYLLKLGEATKTSNSGLLIRALVRCEYPKTTEVFLRLAAKRAKGAKYLDYELRFLFESARYLPAAGLPNLEAFAATLDEKLMGGFLEAIAPLRATPQGS